jgi:hypothetical protein
MFANEKEILEKAVHALREETGLEVVDRQPFDRRESWADYQISIRAPEKFTSLQIYWAEVRKNVGSATIGEAARQAEKMPEKFVLVAEYITQPQARKLRELNVSFFDTAGNAYFKEPEFYVFVSGKKAETSRKRTPRLFRPPGMKLLFAFLTTPNLENLSYRQISAETNVPTPTVGVFMNDLEKAGYLERRLSGERMLVGRNELFKRWVTTFGESFRQTLHPVRFSSRKYDGRWWDAVEIAEYNALWGGEIGGARLTNHLKPATATIYSDSRLPRLQAKYGLVRDERGNVEILEKFWKMGEVGDVAPPLVIYADLIATADERNVETAQFIYDRYLAELAETTA